MSTRVLRSTPCTLAEVPEQLSVPAKAVVSKPKAPSAASLKVAAVKAKAEADAAAATLALQAATQEAANLAAKEAAEATEVAEATKVAATEAVEAAEVGVQKANELHAPAVAVAVTETSVSASVKDILHTIGAKYQALDFTDRKYRQALVIHLLERVAIRGEPAVDVLAKRLAMGTVTAHLLVAVAILYGVPAVVPQKKQPELNKLDLATLLAEFICTETTGTDATPVDDLAAGTAITEAVTSARKYLSDEMSGFNSLSQTDRLKVVCSCIGIPTPACTMDKDTIVAALTGKDVYLRALILAAYVMQVPATGFKAPIAVRLANLILG